MDIIRIGRVAGGTFQRLTAIACCVVGVGLLIGGSGCTTGPDNPANVIPAANQRVAFQSQCAQNVVTCTTSFPTAVVSVEATPVQSLTAGSNSFLVVENNGSDVVAVQFHGSDSTPGSTASQISYEWSYGATDNDPCTMEPGTVISMEADPVLELAVGFHYIRLTVQNLTIDAPVESDECGTISQDTGKTHFVELEVEVRRY